jgi:hypothetical protein
MIATCSTRLDDAQETFADQLQTFIRKGYASTHQGIREVTPASLVVVCAFSLTIIWCACFFHCHRYRKT